MANNLARQVEKVLTAVVGDFIAKATIKKNCALIGVSPENLKVDDLPELANHIEKSITFFSDASTGTEIAEKIRGLSG